ncbi:unnamed protein product [Clonostachys chloroleuca]|uniref:Kinesin motor domain-containing protein n=1 Tax=Clonostachys chloroleuca TaxID=1926264 RepID=A0AA35PYT3_9HYPO|nr:unnamed protein product [Clonostachys chloroleuca]
MAYQRQTRASDRELPRPGMGSSLRSGASTRSSNLRQPTRHSAAPRQLAGRLDRNGAVSPAVSVASTVTAGTKRKERDFEILDMSTGEETNINVVVRCRGRNQREIKENSTYVVKADSVKGKSIELLMGSNAISNKSYGFDRVFSQVADQSMIFEDTVRPILEEMLAGYNCTIFAYGQTGTGKTYTMSGDMTETLGMLSDEAGIIPRVLQKLFEKLEADDTESLVKCSFIELYNEDLRDLLSADESAKLKIYDDASKRGHISTVVQGMEEKHIKNAAEGIKVLQDGSLKRQVAATKCNDLSSRSHTVFTISTYVKKPNENGADEYLSAGKLNLVDLAGSENIQRSGAENKRAAEAGLINKSLLTLGRVINALVDRSAHIPYRESKLTRILQDSLGGRTKTCIIATISPAKSNLEETISTLDYAFRAKNIKNKPQMNPLLNKKTLLKEFSHEIEKLKSELISTRQRNGVYLSNEAYEEMTAQSETRRIVMEEQTAKMETLENNLRNRVQDLHALNVSFIGLKKDHDGTKEQLEQTKNVLDQTEIVLSATRRNLDEETQLRKAHQETEGKLAVIGGELIDKLNKTVHDVSGLHSKNKRKSDLQSLNRTAWGTSQGQVAEVTTMIERRIQEFQDEQKEHISSVSRRMEAFVQEELQKLTSTQAFLDEHLEVFGESKAQLIQQEQKSKDDMDKVLEEIKETRDNVKERVGESLQAISKAAEKISADIVSEMATFHNQLHTSYSTLGKDCKTIFDELVKHITTQRSESDNLRRQLQSATNTIVLQNATISSRLQEALEEERRQAADDRQKLMAQITGLINAQADAQETRIAERATQVQKSISDSSVALEGAFSTYATGMDSWDEKESEVLEEVKKSRDQLKMRLKDDWNTANDRSTSIQNTAKSVHAETVRVVDEQVEDLDSQMEALDDFVTRAKSENTAHHESYSQSLNTVSNTVDQSFGSISGHFKVTFDRVKNLGEEMEVDINDIQESLEPLETQLCRPLANLREEIASTSLQEYQPTGDTPQKVQYHYPTSLPRTQRRSMIISEMDEAESETDEPAVQEKDNNTMVFADLDNSEHSEHADLVPSPRPSTANTTSISLDKATPLSLREVDPNVSSSNLTIGAIGFEPVASLLPFPSDHTMPLFKHSARTNRGTKKPNLSEGRENVPISALVQSTHRRKSPRLN